jgi:hypothetical protein
LREEPCSLSDSDARELPALEQRVDLAPADAEKRGRGVDREEGF